MLEATPNVSPGQNPEPTLAPVPRPMPASIVQAVIAVQRQVVMLGKDHENKFGGFNYTSVDQIYDLLGLKLAEAGLMILPYEVERPEIKIYETPKGPKRYGYYRIGFLLATEKDTWCDPLACETLEVAIESSVTFHGIKSLAQKTFLRGFFKVPTGEADLDAQPGESGPPPPDTVKKAKPLTKAESAKLRDEVLRDLTKAGTPLAPEAKDSFMEAHGTNIDKLTEEDKTAVRKQFAAQSTYTKDTKRVSA